MSTHPYDCRICGTELQMEEYGKGECPNCGARFEYDETYMPRLGPVVNLDVGRGEVTFRIRREEESVSPTTTTPHPLYIGGDPKWNRSRRHVVKEAGMLKVYAWTEPGWMSAPVGAGWEWNGRQWFLSSKQLEALRADPEVVFHDC